MADAGDGDTIEVVFATLDAQDIVTVHYEPGLTAAQAVERSGLRQVHPSIGDSALILGIYGERVDPDHALNIGDRVEICRALKADPRDMRRDMMAHAKVMGGEARREMPSAKKSDPE